MESSLRRRVERGAAANLLYIADGMNVTGEPIRVGLDAFDGLPLDLASRKPCWELMDDWTSQLRSSLQSVMVVALDALCF